MNSIMMVYVYLDFSLMPQELTLDIQHLDRGMDTDPFLSGQKYTKIFKILPSLTLMSDTRQFKMGIAKSK